MAIISVRTDDNTKQEAEKLTKSIGISLSSAVNVFLKRFVEEQGFPFDITPSSYRTAKASVNFKSMSKGDKPSGKEKHVLGLCLDEDEEEIVEAFLSDAEVDNILRDMAGEIQHELLFTTIDNSEAESAMIDAAKVKSNTSES